MIRRLVLLAGFAVSIAGAPACLTPKPLPASSADRGAMVTMEDFAPWLDAHSITLTAEVDSLAKQKVAWSYLLAYEYEGTARLSADERLRVKLLSEVGVHPNGPSAHHNFDTYGVGLKTGIERGGASVVSVEPSLDWGDDIDLFLIEKDGRQLGNGFIGRKGNVAVYVLITGLYSSDPAQFEAVLAPKLRALERYDPAQPSGAVVGLDRG